MIHVASLIHDDVLDEASTRRGGASVHKLYSNKVAVLAGDYLLARASVLLARLENTAVVQIMATALESLVSGEIMQLKSPPEELLEMEVREGGELARRKETLLLTPLPTPSSPTSARATTRPPP